MSDLIASLRERIAAYPASAFPIEHATLRFNLGLALAELPESDRESRLRQAIAEYAAALAGFDRTSHPREHARVLTALGAAERDLGHPLLARDRFLDALSLLEFDSATGEWGAAANGLGLAYTDLGQREEAIAAFRDALVAFGESHPRQRATTLHNLGQVVAASGTAESLTEAIGLYREGLPLVSPAEGGYVWACLHHALAAAQLGMADDRHRHLTEAARCEAAALSVFTRTSYPFQHAIAKNNLGIAYEELSPGDVTMQRRALVAFEDAAAIFDPRLHPELSNEVRAGIDRVLARLDEVAGPMPRPEHFARLAADAGPPERMELMRYRIATILERPEPAMSVTLAELDRAIVTLDPERQIPVTQVWLAVFMEQPHSALELALASRHARHVEIDGEARTSAEMALEAALGDLEIIQRVMVRDMLTDLGHVRPDHP